MSAARSTLARVLMWIGLCGFWVSLAIAYSQFPGDFDWRYMTVSNLFSSKHNPQGYLWGTAGVALCGLMGLLWVVVGAVRQPANCWRIDGRDSILLAVGFVFMVLAASLPA